MELINALGYLVARGPLAEWDRYAADVLGLQRVEPGPTGCHRYRMDDRAYRLAVEDGEPGVAAIGLEALNADQLDACRTRLVDAGFEAVEDARLAEERQVRRLVRSTDPAGMNVEIYIGGQSSEREFVSPRGIRFVAGDLGMGHVFLLAHDAKAMTHYYVETLGFRLSDTIAFDRTEGVFLHCNKRHHSLAFAAVPATVPSGVAHLMLETRALDDVGYAFDRAEELGNVVTTTIGKHTNDRMTSFYLKCPSGFEIEYGWDGRTVNDADWTIGHYTAASSWGHKRVS